MNKTQRYWLFSLLGIVALVIAFMQFQMVATTPYPSYDSFYDFRQVESIHESGFPIFFDELSYQGRTNVMELAFHYTVAAFTFLIPTLMFLKYASIFLWILLVVMIYFISNKLFANKFMVWLMTFFATLSPVLFTVHLNNFEPTALFAIFFLLILNSFLTIRKETSLLFIILILISSFISSLSLIFIFAFTIYVILVKIGSKKLTRLETEIMLFSSVFIAWLHFILYRKLFLKYGVSLFQASVPNELLLGSFYGLSIPMALAIAGIVPLLLGLYGIYFVLFQETNKKHLLIVSFLLSFVIGLIGGFISFTQGFFFITMLLILLSGITIREFNGYLNKTILQKSKPFFAGLIMVLVILNFLPVVGYSAVLETQSPTQDQIDTMEFISENTPTHSTILSTIQEGHLIASVGERSNFFDTNFIFAPQANQRYSDARMMFLSKSQTSITGQLDYYDMNYIYLSPQTKNTYQFTSSEFESGDCFMLVYETSTTKLFEEICNK